MSDEARRRIREFVSRHADGVPVDDDEDLFDSGYANSLFVVQLVVWVERTFELTLKRDELQLENFRTIAAIAALVDSRTDGTRAEERAWISG